MLVRPQHPTGILRQGGYSWWHITRHVAIVAATLLPLVAPHFAQAKTFHCSAGDVQCLIAAINEANASGKKTNTIRLEADVYTLTEVYNDMQGPNGLPSITSALTITGEGEETTIIERAANAPPFCLMNVAATGTLKLNGLTLRRGRWILRV